MSIKTFPGKEHSSFLIFLILSALMHAGIWGALRLLPTGGASQPDVSKPPILVDVVDLPSTPPSELSQEKKSPAIGAQRTQSVKKETWPEPKPAVLVPAQPRQTPVTKPAKPAPVEQKAATGNGQAVKESGTEPPSPIEEPVKAQTIEKPGTVTKENTVQQPKTTEAPRRPSLFPTDERVAELARKYEAEAPKGEVGKTLSLNTSELKYQKYLMDMKSRIEFYWEYPSLAARNGWQGNLKINFKINSDGSVSDISLERSSGYPMLDDAAMTAVRLAAPFPPFPGNFTIEDLNIKGLFTYHLLSPAGRP